ncbi:MAG: Asp-tRNA(Asn)/Glu-tRNA(Gln) amidotransferase subunit GatC [Synergistaceae bacterium]|nr:Asp-tRNA(Asn)/Glu-tRNA(Gln) amidotransferase subunit GatC [Synergistaceae bacterium]
MSLSSDEVREIASEARLLLTEDELTGATRYINDFLDMLDRFDELDLKDVEPFSFAEAMACPLREDVLTPFEARDAILSEGRHVEGGLFKVPRIMEG